MTFAADWVLNAKDQSIVLNSFRSVRLTEYIILGLVMAFCVSSTVQTLSLPTSDVTGHPRHKTVACCPLQSCVYNPSLTYVPDMTSEDINERKTDRQADTEER